MTINRNINCQTSLKVKVLWKTEILRRKFAILVKVISRELADDVGFEQIHI